MGEKPKEKKKERKKRKEKKQTTDGCNRERWKEGYMAMGGRRRCSHPALGVGMESWRFPKGGIPEMSEERSWPGNRGRGEFCKQKPKTIK